MRAAREAGETRWTGSLDLGRSREPVAFDAAGWTWRGEVHPWPDRLKDRTIYHRDGDGWSPVARYAGSLIKLVPTEWGAPTFEIDGIKMLVSARISPIEDARRKVALVEPRGRRVLDTCGGLGYFAASCLGTGVAELVSFEKNPDVLWLRTLNPWSPDPASPEAGGRFTLTRGDSAALVPTLPDAAFDAVLHDPPRFGIAGELYSLAFYRELARVLRRGGRLFHYTGAPNRLTSGRDVPGEVARRLDAAGFRTERALDGVLAIRR